MYQLAVLFYCLAVGVSDPGPNQAGQARFPWRTNPDQSGTSSSWPNSGTSSSWPGSGTSSSWPGSGTSSSWPGSGTSSSWPNSDSLSPSGGDTVDQRGEGWGPQPSWGPESGSSSQGSGGDSGWGSTQCGGTVRRSRCAPSIFEIERQLLGAGQRMSTFCTTFSDRSLREVYSVEHYKLRVQLSEFSEDDVQVRVRQRLVTVLASTCTAEYAAVRILPDVVDARQAVWKMDNHTLTVLFPYNIVPNTEIQSRCGREFHGDPIIVPKCAAGVKFARDYDMSFTDINLRKAIKRILEQLPNEDNEQYVDN